MRDFQSIVFIWTQIYREIIKSALVCLKIIDVTNAPVPVTANTNIKVPVDLKLQLRRRTGTDIYLNIYELNWWIHV